MGEAAKERGAIVRKPVPDWPGYEIEQNGALWLKGPGGFRKVVPSGGIYILKADERKGDQRLVRSLRAKGAALAAQVWGPPTAPAPAESEPLKASKAEKATKASKQGTSTPG